MIPHHIRTILLSIGLYLFTPTAYCKSIALSFDDGVNPAFNTQAEQINNSILKHLHDKKIKSIVFPSLVKIGDYQGKHLIQDWGKSGHLIGNHSALHQNLNKENITAQDYIQSIEQADTVLKTLPNYVRIYRYPFLKEGNTSVKRDTVYQWLKLHQYSIGGVSIDASDWLYNRKYLDYIKQQDQEKLQRLQQAYINHLLKRADYYDQLALITLKRSPQHLLLLHVNAINAAFLDNVITAFQQHGWTFIAAEQALQDPIYAQRSQNIPAGESVIWSIAKTQGITELRYPAEDAPYEIDNLKQHGLQ